MSGKLAALLRWTAFAAVLTFLALGAFLSIYEMVLQGIIPTVLGFASK